MIKRFVTVIAMVAIGLMLPAAPAGAAAPAAADLCYGPPVGTTVTIDADARIEPGGTVRATFDVRANAEGSPVGTLAVSASRGQFDQTYDFTGAPIVAEIGPLARGSYVITAVFTPDDSCAFLGSSATHRVQVGAAGPDTETAGTLPDTGGPSQWWVLLGALLVAGGAGAIQRARRRAASVV